MSTIPTEGKVIHIALAGNPNVGKSVIFNQLTGMSQVVGNWPGKTVKKAEGSCKFKNYMFKIIDLPGIYSLSTYSIEEIVSREYIVEKKPDYIINVVDCNQLERNLFFTIQLQMLNRPMILALNQYDLLLQRGFEIDEEKLRDALGICTQKVVAVHNRGVHELLEKIIEIEEGRKDYTPCSIKFGKEIENEIENISHELETKNFLPDSQYPLQFSAFKLLDNDEHIKKHLIDSNDHQLDHFLYKIEEKRKNLEDLHGETISTILNSEIYNIANNLYEKSILIKKPSRAFKFRNFLDHITIHSILGYLILAVILLGTYFMIFRFGNWISGLMDDLIISLTPGAEKLMGGPDNWIFKLVWNGFVAGLFAGIGGVLPFVIPFYFFIEILQDIGYLPRAAYLMDRFMHRIGVHGKTIIPILLGFGCSVPAVSACAIMETENQRKRSILISSMIPCSAITTIVLGLVAKYLGLGMTAILYLILFSIIISVGKILTIFSDVDESELIIELHDFRVPNFKVILKQTWHRSKEFVYLALPLMIILGVLLQIFVEFNLLEWMNVLLSPITVYFLGLPIGIGVYLIYGILRKELNLILLQLFVASLGITMVEYLSPIQMITFTLITLLYIPCLATFITIKKEAGRKFAWHLLFFRIITAILVAGIFRWIFELVDKINKNVKFEYKILITVLLFFTILFLIVSFMAKLIKHNSKDRKKHYHFKEFSEVNKCENCSKFNRCK
ncbi:MAG: ferrous iron transport protein B, partial [Promethearchaeota archaeon]